MIHEVILQSTKQSTTDKMFAADVPENLRDAVRDTLRKALREGDMISVGDTLHSFNCDLPLSIACARAIVGG